MGYRIVVDQEMCISSGKCVSDEPDVFAFDENELAVTVDDHPALVDERLIKLARQCPGQAIRLFDDTGSEVSVV